MALPERVPDWSWWRHVPTVTLHEAVALSLNVDPKRLRKDDVHAWTAGRQFNEGPEFENRLTLAKRCLGETLSGPVNWPDVHFYDADAAVRLYDFAVWANSVAWDIPPQLQQLLAGDQLFGSTGAGEFSDVGSLANLAKAKDGVAQFQSLSLGEAARYVSDHWEMPVEEAKVALERAFRDYSVSIFAGGSTAESLQDFRYIEIDWDASAIKRHGVVLYGDVSVYRQHLDQWIDIDENASKMRAEREFNSPDWSLGNVLSWIAFRDPALVCQFERRRDVFWYKLYNKPPRTRMDKRPMLDPRADWTLLDSLKDSRLTAIRNGAELPSSYWFGKFTSHLADDLRFRRTETIKCWPVEKSNTSAALQSHIGDEGAVAPISTGEVNSALCARACARSGLGNKLHDAASLSQSDAVGELLADVLSSSSGEVAIALRDDIGFENRVVPPFVIGNAHTIFEWCMIYTDRHPAAVHPDHNSPSAQDRDLRLNLLGAIGGARNDPGLHVLTEVYRELELDIERDRILPLKRAFANDAPDVFDATRCLIDVEPVLALARRRQDFGKTMAELLAAHDNKQMAERGGAVNDEVFTRSGFPERPSKGKHLIDDELERRIVAEAALPSLVDEAKALLDWLIQQHPKVARPTEKTIQENIRARHRQWKANRSQQISP